jgi:hypothetical protein
MIGIVLVGALVTVAVPTTAPAKPVESHVSLRALGLIFRSGDYRYDFQAAIGTPNGGSKTCRQGRKASVFRKEPGRPDTLIGSARSAARFFKVAVVIWQHPDLETIAGDYYATVKQETKRNGPGTMNCLGARSRTTSLNRPDFLP